MNILPKTRNSTQCTIEKPRPRLSNNRPWLLLCLTSLLISCSDQQHFTSDSATLPYAIGSSTRFIHDESRPFDTVAGVNLGIRTLITELWYPIDHLTIRKQPTEFRRATYGDYVFGNFSMHQRMMTDTTFFHLTPATVRAGVTQDDINLAIKELFYRPRQSYIDAPLTSTPKKLPVIVMTHGDAGSRYNMETVCEYLAANGYVVIAPEHTGNSPYSMTGSDPALAIQGGDKAFRQAMIDIIPLLDDQGAYGSKDNYGQSFTPLSDSPDPLQALVDLDRSLIQRLNDLRAALDELEQMNTTGPFAGRLDLDRIGLIGRSFGGSTTLAGLAMEDRFTSGFAVVPPGWVDQRSLVPQKILIPAEKESVLLSIQGNHPFTHFRKPTFILSGNEDSLIIGLAAQQAALTGTTEPSASNPHPAMRDAFEQASVPVVWGLLENSNHSTFGVSGGYWWPQLKSNTQKRTFDPSIEFTLAEPSDGHKMQKEKALAFFDLTIRQDSSARGDLLNQDYRSQGLILEARNF